MMSGGNGVVIRFEDVEYRIGNQSLVRDLSFEILEGELVVLLGLSGGGKTTTLKLINHLLVPASGRVMVYGKNTLEWDAIALRRRIGYVIQEVGLFPHLNVRRNVGLVPELEKWEKERIRQRTDEVLQMVGLRPDEFGNRYPHELSGGQRQRVGVARALCADPPILLMDEPFGALDPMSRSEIQKEFLQLQHNLRKTTVFVTHDLSEAALLGSRIGLMKDGILVALHPRQEFLSSGDPEVQAFLQPFLDTVSSLQSQANNGSGRHE